MPTTDEVRLARRIQDYADKTKAMICFSCAGPEAGSMEIDRRMLGETLRLAGERLAVRQNFRIVGYEVPSDVRNQSEDVAKFMKLLSKGDRSLIFLSKKYLESEYCMTELAHIYSKKPFGQSPPERVLIYCLPDGRLRDAGKGPDSHDHLSKFWKAWVNSKDIALRDTHPDRSEREKHIDADKAAFWFRFAEKPRKFDRLVGVLARYQHNRPLSTTTAENLKSQVASVVDDVVKAHLAKAA